ncbi:hypothetical protein A8L34_16805 [Bacillus sp. FJAT-27264]|uniref:beta-1,6-N-acetylglucosaminyltransferase n=1 Tax=Paenibacillus sp. (strain DSM 101736 / FJAT-27264) TaxID=1850362 RepID=UPI000808103E|nr:beta-1,6-N-acetylglucosaminyltransferase [Bacillus sp. FJAT-27264]OBZ11973.1 hypothetical protein A8L34_16805 [Bacillus sp. FJAT-27264]
MKIAYFIMVHNKKMMFYRLIRAIYDVNNLYLVHVDPKADDSIKEFMKQLTGNHPNIRQVSPRHIGYAAWSMVEVELDAIKELLSWDAEWTHFINLSGQDMPLVKQSQVLEVLSSKPNANYIRLQEATHKDKEILYNAYYIEDCGQLKRLGDREPFEYYFDASIKPYLGSQWKILTRSFAEYAVTSLWAFELKEYFRYVLIPDEHYFPTLFMSSEFKNTLVPGNLRYIILENRENGFNGASVLTSKNLMGMFNSNALFARKFDDQIDAGVLTIIENSLGIDQEEG